MYGCGVWVWGVGGWWGRRGRVAYIPGAWATSMRSASLFSALIVDQQPKSLESCVEARIPPSDEIDANDAMTLS